MRTCEHYCNDIENVENYEQAKADNFKGWDCHHRLETHNSDGEIRLVDILKTELIALGTYYNRPANELIFLKTKEHIQLHNKGKKMSEDFKKRVSETLKGHSVSEETRRKVSEAQKGNTNMLGKHHSEESRRRMSESHKGKHWKLVDGKRVWY